MNVFDWNNVYQILFLDIYNPKAGCFYTLSNDMCSKYYCHCCMILGNKENQIVFVINVILQLHLFSPKFQGFALRLRSILHLLNKNEAKVITRCSPWRVKVSQRSMK